MWPSEKNALDIHNGEELQRFDLGEIVIGSTHYTVLTGYENNERRCWWCDAELKGKALHYCRGHMKQYYNHFNWGYASFEARRRVDEKCENCGIDKGSSHNSLLQVHHIVPLKGAPRFFSAYNLPFNLIVLCKQCHLDVAAAIRPPPRQQIASYEAQIAKGQLILF
jgi:hypothetical protein